MTERNNKQQRSRWVVLIVRVPSDPSRHRVAVWRELRRSGAVQLGQGSWTLPRSAGSTEAVQRVTELVARGGGEVMALDATALDEDSHLRIRHLHDGARRAEWTEFVAECGKCIAELRREIANKKFTLAELDEEEQNVDRLKRWHRELLVRDLFQAEPPDAMQQHLDACYSELERFSQLVYKAVGIG